MIDLPNIPNPYQEGVQLDSSPFTNYYIQQEAHNRAKDEALGQHIDALSKDALNNKNIRPHEEPDYLKKINDWREFVIKNKKEYRKGGDIRRQADNMYADALSYGNQSADAKENDKKIFDLKKDKKIWDMISPEDIASFDKSQLPIGKGYEPVNWAKFQLQPEPFDTKSREQLYSFSTKDIKPSTLPIGTRVNPKDKSQMLDMYETKYDKDALNGIGDNYARAYKNDASFRVEIDNLAKSMQPKPNRFDPSQLDEPTEFKSYNDAFKSVTGKDISNNADLAKAVAIIEAGNKISREEKPRNNKQYDRSADMEDFIKKSGITANRQISVAKEMKRLGLSGSDKNSDVAINNAYSRINNAIGDNTDKKLSEMDLGADDVALIMQIAKNSLSANVSATPDVIKVNKGKDGVAKIRLDAGDGTSIPLGSLSATGVNLKANSKDKKTRAKILGGGAATSTKRQVVSGKDF